MSVSGCTDDPPATPAMDASGPVDEVAYDEFAPTEDCATTPRCQSYQVQSGCVCISRPSDDDAFGANRTGCAELNASGETVRNPEDDFCDEGTSNGSVNFGCMMPDMYYEAGASEDVTLYGVVDVFGNGGDANAIEITVYREGPNGTLGEMLGSATASTEHGCSETEDEIDDDMVVGTRELGYYQIDGIPSETPLIVKASGNREFWRDLYTYNVYIPNSEIEREAPGADECTGEDSLPAGQRWALRPRIISRSDWVSIPLTAGVPEGIRTGSGVVGGEVHDCDNIRVEFAQVNTNPRAVAMTYFNDNPDNPLPVTSRTEGTSILGLYAALDVPAGPVDVAAVAHLDGGTVSLGWYRAQVFDGAVTVVTLRGLRPSQVPTP